ncbi:MAG: polysaccharide deacetylase family protein [Cyanobacteria bacterium P01_D01_bin.156]
MNLAIALLAISSTLLIFLIRYSLKWLSTSYKFQIFGKMISRVNTKEKVVALTYDDGPNAPYTNSLLDVLNEFDAKATFFAVGEHIQDNLEITRRMIAEGHELGNHSYSHKQLINQNLSTIRSEIQKTDNLLSDLGVQSTIHFRAPYGLKRIRLPWELARQQKINVLWDVDPKDFENPGPEKIAHSIVSNVKPGSIVLMHDGMYDGDPDRSQTVTATRLALQQLQQEGYQFKTVSELMASQH